MINPHKPESMQLIHTIIDQQMKLQPDVQYFHIGCDEVWGLGDSPESKEQMERYGMTKDTMFLNHVREVAGLVEFRYLCIFHVGSKWSMSCMRVDIKDSIQCI